MTASLLMVLLAAAPAVDWAAAALGSGVDGRVGEWVTYRLERPNAPAVYWRIAVVAEELDARGRPAIWLELDQGLTPGLEAPLSQLKLLVARGQGLFGGAVTKAFVAFGAEQPRPVDPASVAVNEGRALAQLPSASPVGGVSGRQRLDTALLTSAGTLIARPYELLSEGHVIERFWLCPKVPLFHLAKLELVPVSYIAEVEGFGAATLPMHPGPANTPILSIEP